MIRIARTSQWTGAAPPLRVPSTVLSELASYLLSARVGRWHAAIEAGYSAPWDELRNLSSLRDRSPSSFIACSRLGKAGQALLTILSARYDCWFPSLHLSTLHRVLR